jgi:predicted acylesterase/phospholipase RssA
MNSRRFSRFTFKQLSGAPFRNDFCSILWIFFVIAGSDALIRPSIIPPYCFYKSTTRFKARVDLVSLHVQAPRKEINQARSKVAPLSKTDNKDQQQQWNASGSFGSMLVQIQKSEEALLLASTNDTLTTDQQQVVDLRPIKTHKPSSDSAFVPLDGLNTVFEDQSSNVYIDEDMEVIETAAAEQLPSMDFETAKELDDAIMKLIGTRENLTQDLPGLPLNPLYDSLRVSKYQNYTSSVPLTLPEHYLDRMDRDRKHLAVSIAASTEDVSQWRHFCQENGGLFPILETIRDGARVIRRKGEPSDLKGVATSDTAYSMLTGNARDQYEEETFHAACSACRAIRDLCAISPDLAAVVADGILRANAAWDGGLMSDFQIILQYAADYVTAAAESARDLSKRLRFRNRRDTRLRCQLYVSQLLLAIAVASDDAVHAIRATKGLPETIVSCSSYALTEQTRRWLRYPGEMIKWLYRRSRADQKTNREQIRRPFLEAANLANDLKGQVQRVSNQILAAIGYNKWVPKIPGQRGLRILSLDGGGSRGMAAITAVKCIMDAAGNGADVSDSFDMIVGTSTGGIIAFLVGLQRESSAKAVERYQQLIDKIFVKSALSGPLMLFTTATYDESNFMNILVNILKEDSMLDSRADPAVPLVCCLSSKMSSTPTHVALFRNYNYAGGEFVDPFTIDPSIARQELELPLELEHDVIRMGHYPRLTTTVFTPGVKSGEGSRHPGSFRVLQRYALRASTAAPTVFKPVMMGGEMYCDGGIVASNPTAVAIHEARAIFPDVPIELVVSVGTGAFLERKSAPRVGWDGIIGQIINSATDGEQIHHILEDVLGTSSVLGNKQSASKKTRYFRFNPVVGTPDDFPIDVTDPVKLAALRDITTKYMTEPAQKEKLEVVGDILKGRKGLRRGLSRIFQRR